MAYCGERGIPHSEFLSWHPDDQDKALAWLRKERETCSRCGTHPRDWEIVRFPYSLVLDVCRGCEHLDWAKDDKAYEGAGRYPALKPTDSLLRAHGVIKNG